METIEYFNKNVRINKNYPYICDDVFINFILNPLKKDYCSKCYKWHDQKKINISFFPSYSLCFYCRNKNNWPME